MQFRPNPIAGAVAVALTLGLAAPAVLAQQTESKPKAQDEAKSKLDQVVLTGIRASIQKSIDTKRQADTNVEVVSAEDVGKMPDKNIADALSRLPGVNVQFGGGMAMDEAERVAIRGTSPNLNLVTVNGHALSSGDWHVGDQGASGRSVGFSLLPSQLIGQSIVYKTQRADLTEGGISGSVDVVLRKPLDFRKTLSGEVSVGAVYADLPDKVDPQISGLVAWKNEAGSLGVLVQAYKEDRHLRRDGQEVFSYGVISAAQAAASNNMALAGKRMPGSINNAMFDGVRKREGAATVVQLKPNRQVEASLSAFRTTLKADNYNTSGYGMPTALVGQGWLIRDARIDGDVISSARLERGPNAGSQVVGFEYDQILRQGAKSLSSFYDIDLKLSPSDALTLKARIGTTKGSGSTRAQPQLTFGLLDPNLSYGISPSDGISWRMLDAQNRAIDMGRVSNFVQMSNTAAAVNSVDKEDYLHLDGEYLLKDSFFTAIKWGGRAAKHRRSYEVLGGRWNALDQGASFTPVTGGQLVDQIIPPGTFPAPGGAYPADWASGIGADMPQGLFRYTPEQLAAFGRQYMNWDPVQNRSLASGYEVKERNGALYLMGDFELNPELGGNVGLRMVTTTVDSLSYQALPNTQCKPLEPCAVPGAIVGSKLGTYLPRSTSTRHTAMLPSLNLRWDLSSKLVARASLSRSLGRPNYNELAGAVSLNDTLLTGTSGNPLLKPVTSNNADATLAWYFAPRAYASFGVFTQRLHDYVKAGVSRIDYYNITQGKVTTYEVSSRIGVKARLKGVEAALEMPLGKGFGFGVNGTYVDSRDQDGVEMLGTSRWTYNLRGFYEDDRFSASLAWNHRSDYATGFVGSGSGKPTVDKGGVVTAYNGLRYYKGYGSLSLSLGYKISEDMSIHLDGNNLLNPVRHTYDLSENAPGYWHVSGRQYYLNLRMKY
ncbi:TonB-dependent receptor [Pelomonas sp. CA6]|uniref:TonB-dependent receptor n=1 Tax=Pelomonas sp. CA6 TaxID=2907999 RepID=UPI001F4A6E13|nr:TonB-dependent receptor [Pelomonas sp. CA6]MCH7342224.1 TonB-dependent receptor [Pelomonas sp. CA6]